jgi:hypothetical protein
MIAGIDPDDAALVAVGADTPGVKPSAAVGLDGAGGGRPSVGIDLPSAIGGDGRGTPGAEASSGLLVGRLRRGAEEGQEQGKKVSHRLIPFLEGVWEVMLEPISQASALSWLVES